MRADRLLSILLLLQTRGQVTARELSERLEVSPRTIHRDMEALSVAGVPVYARRGSGGGWVLPDGYRTETAGLNEAEVRAIFLANPQRLLTDLGLKGAAEQGLIKLLSTLPSAHRHDAEQIRQRLYIDVSSWRSGEEAVPLLPQLHAALLDDRRIRMTYARPGAEPAERIIDPLGLVAKGTVWYLIAHTNGDARTYRVSRISQVEVLDEPVTRPPDFDLAAHWQSSKADFVERLPQYRFTALVQAGALDDLRQAGRWSRIESIGPEQPDGRCLVTIRSERQVDALGLALSFGAALEVLEPAELRALVLSELEQALARYECSLYSTGRVPGPDVQ
jgi:predicted DNA-binding transcriptional regulator YafY